MTNYDDEIAAYEASPERKAYLAELAATWGTTIEALEASVRRMNEGPTNLWPAGSAGD